MCVVLFAYFRPHRTLEPSCGAYFGNIRALWRVSSVDLIMWHEAPDYTSLLACMVDLPAIDYHNKQTINLEIPG